MHVSLSLLLLLTGSALSLKQGNFGLLTACTFNSNLRLDCRYAECQESPPFNCLFWSLDGLLPADQSELCRPLIPNHHLQYKNKTTTYYCMLTRRDRKEKKQITIDYSTRKGKGYIQPCKSTAGFLLHRPPTFQWLVVILSVLGPGRRAA
ncbi:uncharacterized protein AB9W97_007275 isoform 1-T1 [Spinachia spinachia]